VYVATSFGNVGGVLQLRSMLMLQPLVVGAMAKHMLAGMDRQRQGK
jgi:hypothetical protein